MSKTILAVLLLAASATISLGQGGTQGLWTATSPMPSPHRNHTATFLGDSKILVAGGLVGEEGLASSPSTAAAVLYRPDSNDWLPVPSMAGDRYRHGAASIKNGSAVLVAGGFNSASGIQVNLGGFCGTIPGRTGEINSAEIFDETTLTWSSTTPMNDARADFIMVRLFDGEVLAAGSGSAEIYNPGNSTWRRTGGMQATRYHAAGTLLPNGQVFVAGGNSGGGFLGTFCPADAELFDPGTNAWYNVGGMAVNHEFGTATHFHMPDGSFRVLVAGGFDGNGSGGALSTVEIWNPVTDSFTNGPDMLVPRVFHAATLREDGKILVTGGINELGSVETRSEVYDPATNTWSIAAPMIFPHAKHTALNLGGRYFGKILVAGGLSGGPATATGEIYQLTPLASRTFVSSNTLPSSNAVSACQPGSITANVTSSTFLGTPTGSLSFLDFGVVVFGTSLDTSGVATLQALLPPGNNSISAKYFGDTNFLGSDSQMLAVQSIAPPITVTGPTTATAGNPLTLTAAVPNGAVAPYNFGWTLPNGSAANGTSIVVTPAIGPNKYAVSGTDSNGCGLGPAVFTVQGFAPGVLLNSQVSSLSRDTSTGNIAVFLLITNNGTDTASVQVTGTTLNNIPTSTTLPVSLGNVVSGQRVGLVLNYPGAAGAPGTSGVLRVNLTYTDSQTGSGGSAAGGFRVTVP